MACHKNSQRKLVREGIVSMFQRLSGGKSLSAINACAKGIAFIGMNEAACTTILQLVGLLITTTGINLPGIKMGRNGEKQKVALHLPHQASLAKGTVEKACKGGRLCNQSDSIRTRGVGAFKSENDEEPGALKNC